MRGMMQSLRNKPNWRTTRLPLLLMPVALLLASCSSIPLSTPETGVEGVSAVEQATLQQTVSQQERIYRVAGPLLVSNAQLCQDNARNLLGFAAKNKYSYSADLADAAQSVLGLDERLQVTGVMSGSGAARAGLRIGDKLVAAEGQPVPTGPQAEREAAAMLVPLVQGRSSIALTVQRNNANMAVNVPLTHACAFPIEIGNADHVNAYNDGRHIMVTRGMMHFTQSDDELAYVIAREMAHNVARHASRLRINGGMAALIENLRRIQPNSSATREAYSRIRAYPQEMDAAADRTALYMLARAGYNIDNTGRFWERLADQYPSSVSTAYTALHPSTGSRLAVIGKTVAEIKDKKLAKKPLIP